MQKAGSWLRRLHWGGAYRGGGQRRVELAGEAFLIGLDLAGEAVDSESINLNSWATLIDHLGERIADAGAELKAVAAKSECVQEVLGRAAPAHHREHVGEIAFDPRPHPNDLRVRKHRHHARHMPKPKQNLGRWHRRAVARPVSRAARIETDD